MTNVTDNLQNAEFASKKWVWLPDDKQAFIKGFVVEEGLEDGNIRVRCVDDTVCFFENAISSITLKLTI